MDNERFQLEITQATNDIFYFYNKNVADVLKENKIQDFMQLTMAFNIHLNNMKLLQDLGGDKNGH